MLFVSYVWMFFSLLCCSGCVGYCDGCPICGVVGGSVCVCCVDVVCLLCTQLLF